MPIVSPCHENKARIRTKYELKESTMLRRVVEDALEMTALAVFLGMIWLWAGALGPLAGV
jgi:hypothetical protein